MHRVVVAYRTVATTAKIAAKAARSIRAKKMHHIVSNLFSIFVPHSGKGRPDELPPRSPYFLAYDLPRYPLVAT
jgi:hypothetical protein